MACVRLSDRLFTTPVTPQHGILKSTSAGLSPWNGSKSNLRCAQQVHWKKDKKVLEEQAPAQYELSLGGTDMSNTRSTGECSTFLPRTAEAAHGRQKQIQRLRVSRRPRQIKILCSTHRGQSSVPQRMTKTKVYFRLHLCPSRCDYIPVRSRTRAGSTTPTTSESRPVQETPTTHYITFTRYIMDNRKQCVSPPSCSQRTRASVMLW